jgi:hypothetical protein
MVSSMRNRGSSLFCCRCWIRLLSTSEDISSKMSTPRSFLCCRQPRLLPACIHRKR